MARTLSGITSVIEDKIYPIISKALDTNDAKFRNNIAAFINRNHEVLFASAPYDRIYFNKTDVDLMFKSLGILESDIIEMARNIFFWDQPINPQCVKEPYVMVLFCAIKYYLVHSKQKYAELTTIYLAFSGKFYASIHGLMFPKIPPSKYPSVMDYIVNTLLTDKYDLRKEGTVYGAVKSICITWLNSYESKIKAHNDDDMVKMHIQQLRDREKSFLKNIAKLYYQAYENRNYLNYETDSIDEKNFRLTDNDAAYAARITESTMGYITSNYVSLDICNKCKDSNVRSLEIKDIIEAILSDNNNLNDIRTVVNILVCDFMRNYPKGKVGSVDFVAYSIKAKPNTKDKYLIQMKETILKWLDENSPNYRKRKSRKATQISYYRSILMYFVLVINKVALK